MKREKFYTPPKLSRPRAISDSGKIFPDSRRVPSHRATKNTRTNTCNANKTITTYFWSRCVRSCFRLLPGHGFAATSHSTGSGSITATNRSLLDRSTVL